MEPVIALLVFVCGIAAGAVAAWLFLKDRNSRSYESGKRESDSELATLRERLEGRQESIEKLSGERDSLQAELNAAGIEKTSLKEDIARLNVSLQREHREGLEKLELLKNAETRLSETFKSLAAQALNTNNDSFLTLAKTKLEPVEGSIKKFDESIKKLETDRVGAYEGLKTQVQGLNEAQKILNRETANLVGALRSPNVRGRWGEVQLRRVVELAGMLDHCDFREQQSQETDGKGVRPDLIVLLPAEKNIVVDSKVPLNSYLDALEATDEATRNAKLSDYAKSVRSHIRQLSSKSYFEHFDRSPEFVVLFIPSEAFFSAALQQEPGLIEEGAQKNVIIATPTTLIALLRAVYFGWRQEQLAENAKQISDLGKELYKRISTIGQHVAKLGKNLTGATDAYNKFVASLENRVLVSARRFSDLQADAHGVEIAQIEPIDSIPRSIAALELIPESLNEDTGEDRPLH
jgi:DNA recombination protein RmuC